MLVVTRNSMQWCKRILNKKWKKFLFGGVVSLGFVLVLIVLWALLYGPLLPWSPVKPGFKKVSAENAYIYYKGDIYFEYADLYGKNVDSVINEIEVLYGLEQRSKVTIFIVDIKGLKQYIPWLGSGIGGATLQIGDTIYINMEKVLEHDRDPLEYLKHEMVHEIIYQNSGLLNAYSMMDTSIFTEGFPVFYGGPTYYEAKEEFLDEYNEKEIVISREGKKAYSKIGDSNSGSFNYTLYGEFIKFLVDNYGQEKVNRFLHRWIAEPPMFRSQFNDIFGKELYEVQEDFDKELKARSSKFNDL